MILTSFALILPYRAQRVRPKTRRSVAMNLFRNVIQGRISHDWNTTRSIGGSFYFLRRELIVVKIPPRVLRNILCRADIELHKEICPQ